jgi:RNA polymerase sigma-70 factor (ECF subfamily)
MGMRRDETALYREDLERARAIERGDRTAFHAVYEVTVPRLFRFARRHVGSDDLAEEITQEALALMFERMGAFRGESAMMTWAFGIARHVLRRHGGSDERLARFEDDVALDALLASAGTEEGGDPAVQLGRDQRAQLVHSVLDRMAPQQAEVLEGKYVLGLSVRELAARTGRSEKSIESTLSRAREAFRAAFLSGLEAEAEA